MFTAIEDEDIEKANEINKKNALTVALLLLDKENPTLSDLYEKICSLSYMGDSRKNFKAEDPNKIKKLASGSREHFDREYRDKTDLFEVGDNEVIKIDKEKLYSRIKFLPTKLYEEIKENTNGDVHNIEVVRDTISSYLTRIIKNLVMVKQEKEYLQQVLKILLLMRLLN